METMNIKEIDELIDKTNKYLTKLLQDRTAIKTKIIVSIVKDIYKDYLYKKEKSDKKCKNKYVKYSTIISKEATRPLNHTRFVKNSMNNIHKITPQKRSYRLILTDIREYRVAIPY